MSLVIKPVEILMRIRRGGAGGALLLASVMFYAAVLSESAFAGGTQAAHEQGLSLGQTELNRVGTKNINPENARDNVPFYKENPAQQNDYMGGATDMLSIGVTRIGQSRSYSSGGCDREGFDPEAAAKSGMGEDKWITLSEEKKYEAIQSQVEFFDQECEGINFLAGQYENRIRFEIDQGDSLNEWNPTPTDPDDNSLCSIEQITTPDEYVTEMCYQTADATVRNCSEEPVIQTWDTGGRAVGYFDLLGEFSSNVNSTNLRILENGNFQCNRGTGGWSAGTSCSASGKSATYNTQCSVWFSNFVDSCVRGINRFTSRALGDGCTVEVTRNMPNGSRTIKNHSFCSPRAPGRVSLQHVWRRFQQGTTLHIDRVTSHFGRSCHTVRGCDTGTTLTLSGKSARWVQSGGHGVRGTTNWSVVDMPDGCWVEITRTSSEPRVVHEFGEYAAGVYGHMYINVNRAIPATQTIRLNFCRAEQQLNIIWHDGCLPYKNVG